MLKHRILSTLKFFDLQDCPLTLLELHKFLLTDIETIRRNLDQKFELAGLPVMPPASVSLEAVADCLQNDCAEEVVQKNGYYCLAGRGEVIQKRLENYIYAFGREKLISKFIKPMRHLPFVRGVALAGSQALGLPKINSDIDLLIITDEQFIALARVFVTLYFQILGLRRHGNKIANRFCLNHYVAMGKIITEDKNLYSAAEYAKLRYLVYPQAIVEFQKKNAPWIGALFPNVYFRNSFSQRVSGLQRSLEKMLENRFGFWLEKRIKAMQLKRIERAEFIVVSEDEFSFHPNNRKQQLFTRFLEFEKKN